MNSKPKSLIYRDALSTVEQRIVDALPEIVEGLIARAKAGDTKMAVYLCDRILGKAGGAEVVPADDGREPLSEEAYLLDRKQREEQWETCQRFLEAGQSSERSTWR